MSCVHEVARQHTAATAEFEDEPAARPNRLQERQDPRSARICMEPEAEMVYECEVLPVIRVDSRHGSGQLKRCCAASRPSRTIASTASAAREVRPSTSASGAKGAST